MKFSLRNCDLFPGTALQCKETFSLLYYEFDAATREPPPWEPESYKQIDVIAADEGRFTNNNEVIINTETRSIEVTKKGVYFAFRDQGACLSLLAVKVYYLTCPEITVGFAHYPKTATGAQLTSIEKIPGTCVKNAVAVQKPHNLCKADGTWSFNSGLCSCMSGYEESDSNTACEPCPVGRFKHNSGNGRCQICPAHSQALYVGSVECRCVDGFYRGPSSTRPPSAPQDIESKVLNGTTVRLYWLPPRDEGGRSDTKYKISCNLCSSKVHYDPPHSLFNQTSVVISGLDPGLAYKFQVAAHNGVSILASTKDTKSSIRCIDVQTGQARANSGVSNIRIEEVKSNSVSLKWEPPKNPTLDVEVYEVRYYERDNANSSNIVITKKDTAEIKNLKEHTAYGFQIRVKTS